MTWYIISIILLSVALLYFIGQTIYYHYHLGKIKETLIELKKESKNAALEEYFIQEYQEYKKQSLETINNLKISNTNQKLIIANQEYTINQKTDLIDKARKLIELTQPVVTEDGYVKLNNVICLGIDDNKQILETFDELGVTFRKND